MTSPQRLEGGKGVLCLRLASLGFAAAGAALLLQGYALAIRAPGSRSAGPSLHVLTADQDIGEVEQGTIRLLRFSIANRSDKPRRIVGANSLCNLVGCLSVADDEFPLVIPGGEQRDLPVRYQALRPGDFEQGITLYTDEPARLELPIAVRGRVVRPESNAAPTHGAPRAGVPDAES
jgi:hypothetical protein